VAPLVVDSDGNASRAGVLGARLEGLSGMTVPVLGLADLADARSWAHRVSGRWPVLFHLSDVRAWKGEPSLPADWQAWFGTLPRGRGIVSFTRETWLAETETQAWMLQAWADHAACQEAALAWIATGY
jgi:hypothetical protein